MEPLSESERERRAKLLQDVLSQHELDGLILASNDYRGHKGAVRWVGDYNLAHRYGYAFVAPDREPELIIPQNLAMGVTGSWDVPIRYPRDTVEGLKLALGELKKPRRIGIVGLNQVMRVEEHKALAEAFPEIELIDASDAFERIRAVKSQEEIAGVRESTDIAERCFRRLLEIVAPGVTERAVGAEMHRTAYAAGGEDFLFLTMYAVGEPGAREPRFGSPRDRVLYPGDQLIFSFELIGPRGYWMELSRMVVLGQPSEVQRRLNAAVHESMDAAAAAMLPGASPADVQRASVEVVESHGARSSYWSGHGIGQDVIEEPWIGLEVVQDAEGGAPWELKENMVLSMHPFITDNDGGGIAYMSNVYVVGPEGGGALTDLGLELFVV